jgi:hypothetical protein
MPSYKSPNSKIGVLRSRLLERIRECPGIHVRELRAVVPDEPDYHRSALSDLLKDGLIVRTAVGCYAQPEDKRRSPPPTGFVRGQSLARLMAGR